MHCSKCGVKNSEEARVCGQCATPLRPRCPQCDFDNPSGFAFCGRCGTSLAAALPEPAAIAAERRHLTVMFCDQVDSVSRSQRLDPEELHEIVRQYQQMCTRVIQEFDGYVAQYQGDGLVVYFGYPVAHEDDAQRAVRAGLGILAALPHLNSRLQQTVKDIRNFPLHLRIGIHTGMTVVGEMGAGERRELTALGDTPNITSRLQGIAKTNAIVISATTYQLICGFFECVSLGPQELKGVSAPVLAYQVLDDSKVQNRFEAALTKGLTPMVGREQELELLLERWAQVKEGEGWVVMLSGEAGIGKSRLVQALKEHLSKEPHLKLEYHCSPYYQNSSLYPTLNLLQRLFRFERADSPQEKFRKLETALERFHLSLIEIVPLLASFLSLPLPEQYPPLTLSSQRQRQKLQESLRALLVAQTENQPVLQVIEDLHWADPSTLEGLSFFVNRGSIPRSLTLLTFRPEFSLP